MEAKRRVGVLFAVLASVLMLARLVQCKQKEFTQPRYLPVRTYVVDDIQDSQSGFAVYQDVAPGVRLQQLRKPPPSVQLCTYDRLGSHSWPPTAVCWVPPTQQHTQAVQNAADSAAAAAERTSAAFQRLTSPGQSAMLGQVVADLVVLEVGLPGQEGQSFKLNTVEHFVNKTGELLNPCSLLESCDIAVSLTFSCFIPQGLTVKAVKPNQPDFTS